MSDELPPLPEFSTRLKMCINRDHLTDPMFLRAEIRGYAQDYARAAIAADRAQGDEDYKKLSDAYRHMQEEYGRQIKGLQERLAQGEPVAWLHKNGPGVSLTRIWKNDIPLHTRPFVTAEWIAEAERLADEWDDASRDFELVCGIPGDHSDLLSKRDAARAAFSAHLRTIEKGPG